MYRQPHRITAVLSHLRPQRAFGSLPTGAVGEAVRTVSDENTAIAAGSGSLRVFATPSLVALMEEAACAAVLPFLEAGETTVGTGINTSHIAATAVGSSVRARATVTKVDGKSLAFGLVAHDSTGALVGEGTHTRAVLGAERFMAKLDKRAQTGLPE